MTGSHIQFFYRVNDSGIFLTVSIGFQCENMSFPRKKHFIYMSQPIVCYFFCFIGKSDIVFFSTIKTYIDLKYMNFPAAV